MTKRTNFHVKARYICKQRNIRTTKACRELHGAARCICMHWARYVVFRRDLRRLLICLTLYDMETSITVRLDKDLAKRLSRVSQSSHKSQSEIIRDALRRQLAVLSFEQLRRRAAPFAEARGYLEDEDVFRDVS